MHRFYSDIEQCFWKFDCSCKLIFTDFLADKIVGIIEKFGKRVGIVTDHGVEKLNYYTNIHKNLKDLCQAEGHIKYESDLESIQAAIKNFKKV